MDEGLLTSNIFIDRRKAFDTLDHTTLLRKTKLLWFPRQISKLVLSHTSKNRRQQCYFNGVLSDEEYIAYGLPRRSV